MKEKMHITVLSLGVCALVSMTFAVSMRDYKEKTPKLNSATILSGEVKKFECSKESASETSLSTREYNKNLEKMNKFLERIDILGGENASLYLEDPCQNLRGMIKTECNINNVELIGLIRQVKKLEEKMLPYEECMERLGLLESENTKTNDMITEKREKNKDTKIPNWSEGEWSACTNGKQTRKVECYSEGKRVLDNKCEGKKPGTIKTCTKTEKNINTVGGVKDCGTMNMITGEEVTENEIKKLSCISDAILKCESAKISFKEESSKETTTYTVYRKKSENCLIGIGTSDMDFRCDIPVGTIKDLEKYAQKEDENINFLFMPIGFLIMFEGGVDSVTGEEIKLSCKNYKSDAVWHEGVWSTCLNEGQTRDVECQLHGKKVDEKECASFPPSTYRKCITLNNSSKNSEKENISKSICQDSDGGNNIYIKGIITYPNNPLKYPSPFDNEKCEGDGVWETQCEWNETAKWWNLTGQHYSCPKGCKDGACIK